MCRGNSEDHAMDSTQVKSPRNKLKVFQFKHIVSLCTGCVHVMGRRMEWRATFPLVSVLMETVGQ